MARILICHVPKDGTLARELGAALMGRDHFVSFDGEPDAPRPDRVTRLRQFDAVMVLWTDQSLASAGLEDIAKAALPANLLVPVRAETVAPGALPLSFRKLNMYAPRDLDAINRTVIRLGAAAAQLKEMAARDADLKREAPLRPPPLPPFVKKPAPKPAAPASPATAAPPAPAKPANAPPPAPPGTAEAKPAAPPEASGVPAPSAPAEEPARAAPVAVRRLELPEVAVPSGPAKAAVPPVERPASEPAAIKPAPSQTPVPVATAIDLAKLVEAGLIQLHMPSQMWLAEPVVIEVRLSKSVLEDLARTSHHPRAEHGPLETLSVSLYSHGEAFEIERQSERTQFVNARTTASRERLNTGRWMWLVTPAAAGEQALVLRVSALLRDRHGVPTPVALPDRRLPVLVDAPEGSAAMQHLMNRGRR